MTPRSSFLAIVLLPIAAAVCYRPLLIDCTIRCDPAQGCPSPLQCLDGYCTRSAGCPARVDAGSYQRPEVPPDLLPTAIPGLALWLDPEVGIAFTPTLLWRDRSGAHADATATGTPSIWPAAGGYPPMFEFSGERQFLTVGGEMRQVGHVFVVAEPREPLFTTTDGGNMPFPSLVHFIYFSAGSLAQIRYGIERKDGRLFVNSESSTMLGVSQWIFDLDNGNYARQLFEVSVPGGPLGTLVLAEHFKNGMSLGTAGTSAAMNVLPRTINFIGRGGNDSEYYFHGLLCEIIIYDHALPPEHRLLVESYLLGKWNLPDLR